MGIMIADKVEKLTLCGSPIILRKIILISLSLLPNIAQADRFIDRPISGSISHLNTRYLNLITGRFITQDIRKQFFSHYVYGNGRVILSSDPSGEVFPFEQAREATLIFDSSRTEQVVRGETAPISASHEEIVTTNGSEAAKNTKSGNEVIQAGSSPGNPSIGPELDPNSRNGGGKDISEEEHNAAPPGEDMNAPPDEDMNAPPDEDMNAPPDEDMNAPPDDVESNEEKLIRIGAARSIEEYDEMVDVLNQQHAHKPRVMTEERLKAMGAVPLFPE
ncbi:hypothetical protein [Bathymodiolus japonicus methanotrophic gill symbiont]|uniref:hypothetical protein n=1 Tax=Bathymodiolus japonicus methanotrophic gill symbiont TaxID=113269 RepID=UPI001C8D1D6C|nr:hypothetical protein [Bathymodiolus japonicus methanotrophic gill symbiont]